MAEKQDMLGVVGLDGEKICSGQAAKNFITNLLNEWQRDDWVDVNEDEEEEWNELEEQK